MGGKGVRENKTDRSYGTNKTVFVLKAVFLIFLTDFYGATSWMIGINGLLGEAISE